jgi:histidine ammonia-lyase
MFDAKSVATKALIEAKRSGKGNNMGTALQIEMALEQARAFEEELKMLFMQTGKIDVWNKIKARQAEMDRDDAIAIRKLKDEEKKAKEQEEYYTQIASAVGAVFFVLFLVFVGINELTSLCPKGGCGR